MMHQPVVQFSPSRVEVTVPPPEPVVRRWITTGRCAFFLLVLLPTVVCGYYLTFVATKKYESTAHFVVRAQEANALGGLGSLVQSVTSSASFQDAYAVTAFIKTHDALDAVERQVDYRALVADPAVDPLSRFATPLYRTTREGLLRYYNRNITATLEPRSGIVALRVTAFSPQSAYDIAQTLMGASEDLVNRMNDRERAMRLNEAQAEVTRAEEALARVSADLRQIRIETGIIDPQIDSATSRETLSLLQQTLTQQRASYLALREGNPNSPLLPARARALQAMENELARTRDALAGRDGSLAEKFSDFEALNLSREFAAQALTSARAALEQARVEFARKSIVLAAVSAPNLPESHSSPRILRDTLTLFLALFIGFGVMWLIVANMREHHD